MLRANREGSSKGRATVEATEVAFITRRHLLVRWRGSAYVACIQGTIRTWSRTALSTAIHSGVLQHQICLHVQLFYTPCMPEATDARMARQQPQDCIINGNWDPLE
jgi:hypothetical protein